MGYKPSIYNILLDREEPYLLFNTFRGSLARIERDNIETVRKLLNDKKIKETGDNDLSGELLSGGFLVQDELNELEYLKQSYFRSKFNTDIFELVFIVTKACNFRCIYCFEDTNTSEYITSDRIEKIVNFAEERIKRARIMYADWFGGEPLVRFSIIEELTERFIKLCDRYSCEYSALMTTNGYLLTPEVANKLTRLKIKTLQITLDGPREIHNKRRMLKGGGETYDVIMDNIRYIVDNDIPVAVNIRCNIDKENVEYLRDWIEVFPEDLRSRVSIHFAPVTADGEENCPAITRREVSIDAGESGDKITELLDFASDERFGLDFEMKRRNRYCDRDRSNQFVVGADLSLIACPIVMNKIGYITKDGKAELDLAKYINWLSKDPFSDNECKKCKLLPLCFGGCNLVRVKDKRRGCIIFRYNTEKWIRLLYKAKIRGKSSVKTG